MNKMACNIKLMNIFGLLHSSYCNKQMLKISGQSDMPITRYNCFRVAKTQNPEKAFKNPNTFIFQTIQD